MQEVNKVPLMNEPSFLALTPGIAFGGGRSLVQSSCMEKSLRIKTVFNICAGLSERSDLSSLVLTIPFSGQPLYPRTLGEPKERAQINPATEQCFLLLHLKRNNSRNRRYGRDLIKACKRDLSFSPQL